MGKSKKAAITRDVTTTPKIERKSKSVAPQPQEQTPAGEAPAVVPPAQPEPVVTTRKPKKGAAPKAPREERNGVKRPGPGKCLEVWEYLDKNGDMKPADLKPVAVDKGWNQNNALIELYQWRKFNGAATK